MILAYILKMPTANSWNGRWSGEDSIYCVVKNFGNSKKAIEKCQKILAIESFRYNFSDGWVAKIEVSEVTAQEARILRKSSKGFCGYDWMIDSINENLEIKE